MQAIEERFVGTWRLLDWTMQAGEGPRIHPYGPDASGYILYTEARRMSVTLQEQGRPGIEAPVPEVARLKRELKAGNLDALGPDEIPMLSRYFLAGSGYMAYCGTFEVRGDEVLHHVENSLFPEWIDTDLTRGFRFDADELLLFGDAGGLVQHLRWQRVP